ncbi:Rrf2 family transcriptional regulator [Deltaproteobacteria bacterium]|nr:Rrf2 family transcriptional regulator [Deltaproteobacteria bacterium]
MKLSTRSRYGTRLMADLAQHYNEGPVQLGKIAIRQDISIKYLEQLITPLKKARLIKSVRGPKGGHMLSKSPADIKIGEIVAVLEKGTTLTQCLENPDGCGRSKNCKTRDIWKMATNAMYDKLNAVKLSEIVE